MKTIKMPKKLLDDWLAALRSGEYPQAISTLFDGTGYCCLGVLQKVADGEVQRDHTYGNSLELPTVSWLDAHEISFADVDGEFGRLQTPYLPALNASADTANDRRRTFAEIADAIEASAEST